MGQSLLPRLGNHCRRGHKETAKAKEHRWQGTELRAEMTTWGTHGSSNQTRFSNRGKRRNKSLQLRVNHLFRLGKGSEVQSLAYRVWARGWVRSTGRDHRYWANPRFPWNLTTWRVFTGFQTNHVNTVLIHEIMKNYKIKNNKNKQQIWEIFTHV